MKFKKKLLSALLICSMSFGISNIAFTNSFATDEKTELLKEILDKYDADDLNDIKKLLELVDEDKFKNNNLFNFNTNTYSNRGFSNKSADDCSCQCCNHHYLNEDNEKNDWRLDWNKNNINSNNFFKTQGNADETDWRIKWNKQNLDKLKNVTPVAKSKMLNSKVAIGTKNETSGEINLTKNAPGNIKIDSGTNHFAEVDLTYISETFKPNVVGVGKENIKKLSITSFDINQNKEFRDFLSENNASNESWNLKLNKDFPTDINITNSQGSVEADLTKCNVKNLNLNTSLSDSNLNLKNSKIEDVDIKTNLGDLTLDLSSSFDKTVNVDLDVHLGDATIYIPKDFGVKIDISENSGSLNFSNFKAKNDILSNQSFDSNKPHINIKLKSELGKVKIIQK